MGIICHPPGWNRVNWSSKICTPRDDTPGHFLFKIQILFVTEGHNSVSQRAPHFKSCIGHEKLNKKKSSRPIDLNWPQQLQKWSSKDFQNGLKSFVMKVQMRNRLLEAGLEQHQGYWRTLEICNHSILADRLTLCQRGGADYAPHLGALHSFFCCSSEKRLFNNQITWANKGDLKINYFFDKNPHP